MKLNKKNGIRIFIKYMVIDINRMNSSTRKIVIKDVCNKAENGRMSDEMCIWTWLKST